MERRNFARSRLEGQIAYVAALALRREDRRQWEIWSVRFSAHALLVSILHAPPATHLNRSQPNLKGSSLQLQGPVGSITI
jgi:hypothetical protein